MKCRECHVFGDLGEALFEQQAAQVMENLEGEETIDIDIIALDDGVPCSDVFEKVPVNDREEFLEICRGSETSVSFRSDGQEFLLIKTGKDFLKETPEALRGLIAHELVHTVQRNQDLENRIEQAAKDYEEEMIQALSDSGLSDDEINRFIHTVFQTGIFALKDLFANRELIQQGFASELETYYYHMLGLDTYCPMPEFYGEEKTVDDVQDAITFELGLLPAWAPFHAMDRDVSGEIEERISECYTPNLPRISQLTDALADLYQERREDPQEFMDSYFNELVEHSIQLMEEAEDHPE